MPIEMGMRATFSSRKAPAATIETLALAVRKLFKVSNPIRVIGPGTGKTLRNLADAGRDGQSRGSHDYYRVIADNRDLNYAAYFTEGQKQVSKLVDYNSQNTRRLTIDQMARLLLKLDYVRDEVRDWKVQGSGEAL
jgi:UDP-glucose 4-epimerase